MNTTSTETRPAVRPPARRIAVRAFNGIAYGALFGIGFLTLVVVLAGSGPNLIFSDAEVGAAIRWLLPRGAATGAFCGLVVNMTFLFRPRG